LFCVFSCRILFHTDAVKKLLVAAAEGCVFVSWSTPTAVYDKGILNLLMR
jgi:hypothetical protein